MIDTPLIEKASGEKEHFDPDKLRRSLIRAGTTENLVEEIVEDIILRLQTGMTTQEIYKQAFALLKKKKWANAARYRLKKAIMELGPTGYPFENFVGQVLAANGFTVEVGQVLQGQCVTHEIDVVATYNNTQYLVECKFYNSQGKYSSVQVPLYVRSRVDDIIAFRQKLPEFKETRFFGWVVTNTRFTEDALQYGRCAGLHMLSWDLPKNKSLKDMVEKANVYPITVLTGLNQKQKAFLLKKGLVLCGQLRENPAVLNQLGLSQSTLKSVLKELDDLQNE